ncbi:hypothetical protein QQX10_10730 [Demequina sp. SYSU T00039]|uniref:Uncharacterized protein n=1 Tax=Demequina lignilytica TaxID=3051663 RepID=A0AAW7M641_9MICO|nr:MULTISPECIES: hypothetical protein [unclassified Demequina]MDN4478664.1 hypothetical protein [Demequina sp. SYSU T00039-1]MDN4488642.1 hypothetical protein [Demequina sp. SYSU T00039]
MSARGHAHRHSDVGCITRKRRFRDHQEAVHALHGAQQFARLDIESSGSTKRAECRTYECYACNGWHLTSQPAPGAVAA